MLNIAIRVDLRKCIGRIGILGVWGDIVFGDYERERRKKYVPISAGQVKRKS